MQPKRVHYSDGGSSSMRYQQRSRRASFDQIPSTTKQDEMKIENPNHFTLNNKQKQQLQLPIYTSTNYNSTDTSANGDISILIAPSSGDSINDSTTKTSSGSSLLTGFLLHLNSLLPEYCQHLADISTNTLNCTNSASKAVDVLERGPRTLSTRFSNNKDMSNSSSKSSTTPQASPIMNKGSTSEPSSPSYLVEKTSPKSTSPSDLRTWISSKSPLSPLSPRISQSNRRSLSPSKRNRSSSRNKQRRKELSPSLMKVEWERFIDAFISLAGAECFYSRLDHVPTSSSGTEKGKKSKGVKFDGKESSSNVSSASPTDANKRGSRRLVSSYHQIQKDLHIVGEYLVDPVIGKSSTAISPTSSPNKNTSPIKQAAVELRNKLDTIICFIDARCTLIQVHAELCCPLGSNIPIKVGSNKWVALAEQCHLAMIPIKAKEVESCTKSVMLNTDKELRALELFLASIDSLLQCNFFDCVVKVRKLHVHLGRSPHQTCLPIIQKSLPRLFAVMHIYFDKIGDNHLPLTAVLPLSKRRSFDKVEKGETSHQSKENIKMLFDELIGNNKNRSPPLALGLVHANKAVDIEEQQQSSEDIINEEKCPEDSSSWEILYMKTTLTTTNPSGKSIKKQSWPLNHWEDVEKMLTKHSLSRITTTDPLKYNIPSSFITSCHISSISDSVSLIVIQGIDHHTKRQRTSDDDIKLIMRRIHSELSPQNILSVKSVIRLKSELSCSRDADKQKSDHSPKDKIVSTQSLWSDNALSEQQMKKTLQNALRKRKNSPIITAPLKSPYIKRKLRQNRKKTRKNSINSGHLDLFLGPVVSKMLLQDT